MAFIQKKIFEINNKSFFLNGQRPSNISCATFTYRSPQPNSHTPLRSTPHSHYQSSGKTLRRSSSGHVRRTSHPLSSIHPPHSLSYNLFTLSHNLHNRQRHRRRLRRALPPSLLPLRPYPHLRATRRRRRPHGHCDDRRRHVRGRRLDSPPEELPRGELHKTVEAESEER